MIKSSEIYNKMKRAVIFDRVESLATVSWLFWLFNPLCWVFWISGSMISMYEDILRRRCWLGGSEVNWMAAKLIEWDASNTPTQSCRGRLLWIPHWAILYMISVVCLLPPWCLQAPEPSETPQGHCGLGVLLGHLLSSLLLAYMPIGPLPVLTRSLCVMIFYRNVFWSLLKTGIFGPIW